jgi:hypothetical protein
MKKFLTTAALLSCLILTASAQTASPRPPEEPIYIKVLPSQLNQLQQILQFSFQWLPTSDAKAKEVGIIMPIIQQLYPLLIADTAYKKKTLTPLSKKK